MRENPLRVQVSAFKVAEHQGTVGQLVEEPGEQAVRARILELRTAGQSFRVIADTLTSEDLKPKRGGEWHPETIRRILTRAAS